MNSTCEGGGRNIPAADLPPDEAVTCPVCGRQTTVDGRETDGEMVFSVAEHQKVVRDPG